MRSKRMTTLLTIAAFALGLGLGPIVSLSVKVAAQAVQVKNRFAACIATGAGCDNVFTVGGTMTIASGATTNVVVGLGNGYKLARGSVTLDGSNPSSGTTGLATIVACVLSDERSAAPGDEVAMFTTITDAVAGRLDIYAWTNTGGTDPTLVASSDSNDVVKYVCIGT